VESITDAIAQNVAETIDARSRTLGRIDACELSNELGLSIA